MNTRESRRRTITRRRVSAASTSRRATRAVAGSRRCRNASSRTRGVSSVAAPQTVALAEAGIAPSTTCSPHDVRVPRWGSAAAVGDDQLCTTRLTFQAAPPVRERDPCPKYASWRQRVTCLSLKRFARSEVDDLAPPLREFLPEPSREGGKTLAICPATRIGSATGLRRHPASSRGLGRARVVAHGGSCNASRFPSLSRNNAQRPFPGPSDVCGCTTRPPPRTTRSRTSSIARPRLR